MANYYASARTNYFKVKDMAAFESAIHNMSCDLEVHTAHLSKDSSLDDPYVCLLVGGDSGGWPCWDYNGGGEDVEEIDWAEFFKTHLQENQVAVVSEAGAEKLRYITGYSTAYAWNGRVFEVNIDDIYALVRSELGNEIEVTEAAY